MASCRPRPMARATSCPPRRLVTHFERRNGVDAWKAGVRALAGDGAGLCRLREHDQAPRPRCATLFAGTARDADVSRSVGFEFTPGGLETIYLRSRAVLATRAAGKNFPIVGLWQDLKDIDGAWAFARQNKQLGLPRHGGDPSQPCGHRQRGLLALGIGRGLLSGHDRCFRGGGREGARPPSTTKGMHIDYAHVKTAKEVIALHAALQERNRS